MSEDAFAMCQRVYAEHRIATFPVRVDADGKKPLVRGYQNVGLRASAQLAEKFPDAPAFGYCTGPRSKVTVLDIDSPDEKMLAEALDQHGNTPIIVKTASGKFHAYYKYKGEKRLIRPDPSKPIDILGGGFVVAPPSRNMSGNDYRFIHGGLDDLPNLPVMRVANDNAALRPAIDNGLGPIPEGKRDNTLFKALLREARHCTDFDSLLDVARSMNMNCVPPLSDSQVIGKAKKAWHYETAGTNWVGQKARATTDRAEILALSHYPAAPLLLNLLRVSHPNPEDDFAISQIETAELLGWSRETLRRSIQTLIDAKRIVRAHYGTKGKGDPHLYRLCSQKGDRV